MTKDRGDRQREALVQVAEAESPFAAQLVRDQLKEAGIPSTLRNRSAAVNLWTGPMMGHYEVFVLERDAALANAVLGGPPPEELPSPALPPARASAPSAAKRRRRWWRA